jgi:16S rRNA (cytosine1402-N4)-methyltransferase
MDESQPVHVSVLLEEIVDWLDPQPGKWFVDGTLGGGGHTRALAERVGTEGGVIAMDLDEAAIERAEKNLSGMPVQLVQENYCNLLEVLPETGIGKVDGIVMDLGLSSDQLADRGRGFSFDSDGPLDLRFDVEQGEPAYRLIGRLGEKHLADLIYAYGEERYSRRIARKIVERRRQEPIETAADLAMLVRKCIPKRRGGEKIDPATRTFQALRIAVNDELKSLEIALRRMPDCLKPGGRIAVISFHSLEDRRVKEAFREDDRLRILTKRPIGPGPREIETNRRSRSAKLRVAERI